MRCKEWYGWHFPELAKIIQDNVAYCKTVQKIGQSTRAPLITTSSSVFPPAIGYRTKAAELDLSDILPADVEVQVREAAEISMGTEISEEDITNIRQLCDQVRLVTSFRGRTRRRSRVRISHPANNLWWPE